MGESGQIMNQNAVDDLNEPFVRVVWGGENKKTTYISVNSRDGLHNLRWLGLVKRYSAIKLYWLCNCNYGI